ncbi:MAG: hypothetical protein J6I84_02920 [Bacilli bacterium]|nr:hypothetical protein [Bacilli bacterium]
MHWITELLISRFSLWLDVENPEDELEPYHIWEEPGLIVFRLSDNHYMIKETHNGYIKIWKEGGKYLGKRKPKEFINYLTIIVLNDGGDL